MIELLERVALPLPAGSVWALLADPLVVASCISGATLEKTEVPDVYAGSMRVKFGPTVISFLGQAHISYDDASRSCKVEGRGHDKRGASNAAASIVVAVEGADDCELLVSGSFALTGPLEGFARSGGIHIARVLLKDFAANLARRAESMEDGASRPSADVLNAASVTGQVTRQWVAGMFQKKA